MNKGFRIWDVSSDRQSMGFVTEDIDGCVLEYTEDIMGPMGDTTGYVGYT